MTSPPSTHQRPLGAGPPPARPERRRHRLLRWQSLSVGALLLAVSCVFGPEVHPIIDVDNPPYIDLAGLEPNPADEPVVAFDLSSAQRTRNFQARRVIDEAPDEDLTYAFVIRLGDDAISIPPADQRRPSLDVVESASEQTLFTVYETGQQPFDPCRYGVVLNGLVDSGTIQVIVYDRFPEELLINPDDEPEYQVRWLWTLEFSGQCPVCVDQTDCLPGESCIDGLCTLE